MGENRYAYANNSPLNLVDVTGREADTPTGGRHVGGGIYSNGPHSYHNYGSGKIPPRPEVRIPRSEPYRGKVPSWDLEWDKYCDKLKRRRRGRVDVKMWKRKRRKLDQINRVPTPQPLPDWARDTLNRSKNADDNKETNSRDNIGRHQHNQEIREYQQRDPAHWSENWARDHDGAPPVISTP